MKIMIKNGTDKWKPLDPVKYADEAQLQKMLYESPELIPLASDDSVAIFIRECELPGSGATDLLGVDSDGNILIIETKLAKNPESRRKVVGQVFEYAAYLWGMPFEAFDDRFLKKRGRKIVEEIADLSPDHLSLDRDALGERISGNLKAGRFQLLIAVDQMNDELERIVDYLAACGGEIKLVALELEVYVHGETKVLVPRRFGGTETGSPPATRKLTLEEVIANAQGAARERFKEFVDAWKGAGKQIDTGRTVASFKAEINGKWQTIFWVSAETLQANFGDLPSRGAPKDAVDSFREGTANISGFDSLKVRNQSQPLAKLTALTQQDVHTFVGLSEQLVKDWRKSSSSSGAAE